MSTGKLFSDTFQIRTLGNNVNTKADLYAAEVAKIYNNINMLTQAWEGDDNKAYIEKVNSHKTTIENLGKAINDYGNFLISTANSLEGLNDEIANAAKNL